MILITGGTGFIGSHTAIELIEAGHKVVILDNLSNSHKKMIDRIDDITGYKPIFVEGDIRDEAILKEVFSQYDITMVIHFASLKAVGESVSKPLEYYDNNVAGSLNLLEAMKAANVKNIVFSSSATVYGDPKEIPITENCPIGMPTNPYGQSKVMVEKILQDLSKADNTWSIALLRYFNPVGAHSSGLIGELPGGTPNNLMPYITQVASGKLKALSVYGDDYPTEDGTGVRDYIHVVDLAKGHLKACDYIHDKKGVYIWNLGTGKGNSVLDVIKTFEKETGQSIPYNITARREGDIATCYADCQKAKKELNWQAEKDLSDMVKDSWRWEETLLS
ncbi:UDP-glucose 4-epimerase GalE [Fangia hongkongensis]|uniref:UDP-glucose 4-epimerase GalE n=1 Tax=Fangia hongkongensis TaxID=270495 RepID=UPI0003693A07|nr:UDP-glucose 4-epimerase GalE [Fangia hongkongensis]MBK2124363.1 UDP-glucose 4-epimerase GalE [Fangia hongkongensis]